MALNTHLNFNPFSNFSFSKNNYVYVSIYILNPLMALKMYNGT